VVSTSTFASADDAELRMTCEAFAPGSAFALTDTSGGVNNHGAGGEGRKRREVRGSAEWRLRERV
jgi:hypothetical protein